jgi:phage-related protein
MPLCRPMGAGLYEVRTALPTSRISRVMVTVYRKHLVVLHGFIKKTQLTPAADLALARERQKELHHE